MTDTDFAAWYLRNIGTLSGVVDKQRLKWHIKENITEDVLQDAFMRQLSRCGTLTTEKHAYNSTCLIARNILIDWIRHRGNHWSMELASEVPSASSIMPELEVLFGEIANKCVSVLSPSEREALIAKIESPNMAEAAINVDKPYDSFRRTLIRLYEVLQPILTEYKKDIQKAPVLFVHVLYQELLSRTEDTTNE
jgi:DNA-directed RNA polymerase specialized sigma24 family protein